MVIVMEDMGIVMVDMVMQNKIMDIVTIIRIKKRRRKKLMT
jgi:hypothetical protein